MQSLKYIITLSILLVHFSGNCQSNQFELDNSERGFNSVSTNKDSSLILIGQQTHIDFIQNDKITTLHGSYAMFDMFSKHIVTLLHTGSYTSLMYVYKLDGTLMDYVQINGNVTGMCNSTDQHILITVIVDNDGVDSGILLQVNLVTGEQKNIFSPDIAELTSVNVLSNNNIALTGTNKNFIMHADGTIVKEIPAPARSFGKLNAERNMFLILQEFSDGSYIDLYTQNGDFVKKIEFNHKKKSTLGTRRCSECITKIASFIYFDLSPDTNFLVAKDHFNEVYVLNSKQKLIKVYTDSQNWSYMAFVNSRMFSYLDEEDKKIKFVTVDSK